MGTSKLCCNPSGTICRCDLPGKCKKRGYDPPKPCSCRDCRLCRKRQWNNRGKS